MRERVAAIIERDGLVLMVRHRSKDASGRHVGQEYLTLPGGGIEPGETSADAVRREVAEEVCLRVTDATFVRRVEHRQDVGATSIFRAHVDDGPAALGTDPELECTCPRLVGLEWIPAPGRGDWEGPDVWSHLKVAIS
ncbi:NUDIX domain-containing protein [Nocardioides sp. SR21]|uniref:NUDIX domain-containing protein n=1 Tax=Nocardioides sp. SR21 TaxID=2919501 RepID=UPI001FA96F1F|nr:NUDIX domain-containing protein [Nocardioides sp. SR21]